MCTKFLPLFLMLYSPFFCSSGPNVSVFILMRGSGECYNELLAPESFTERCRMLMLMISSSLL